MDASSAEPPKKAKSSFLSFLAWWQVDPQEVQKQVDQYDTLSVWQSARRLSGLLCALSVCLTLFFGGALGLSQSTILSEVVIWGVLGLFMYRGSRWAFVLGMLLWTFKKGALIVDGV